MAKYSADDRRTGAREGWAMSDGSFPIRDRKDVQDSIDDTGRTTKDKAAVRRHIVEQAKKVGAASLIPPDWNSDGTTKTSKFAAPEGALLVKSDAQQIVYAVVLTPGVRDSQGDIVSAQDIEKAAHKWLVEYRKSDVQHNEQQIQAVPVESFCAPCDFEIGGQQVLKGAWVTALHVADPDTWARVQKGDLGGVSIGGTGERYPDEVDQ